MGCVDVGEDAPLLGFRLTGIAPVDVRMARATGFANMVDLAQKDRCRRCGIVAASFRFNCRSEELELETHQELQYQ